MAEHDHQFDADEDGDGVPDCNDEPKLTDEEWEYILAVEEGGS